MVPPTDDAERAEHARQHQDAAIDRAIAAKRKGDPFQAWTITLPDGSGFDIWIHNLHEPSEGLRWLLDLANVEGYGTIAKEVPKP